MLLSAFLAEAQLIPAKNDIPTNDPGIKYGFQSIIGIEKKLSSDLKANIGTELRMQGDFLYDRQWRFNVGAEYKLAKRFSLIGEYTLIRKHKDGDRVSYRHRVKIGLQESLKFSKKAKLTFSEKLQWTHRAGKMNIYQNARNNFATKLKVKFTYSISKKFDLSASEEARLSFSEPDLDGVYYDAQLWQFTNADGSPVGKPGWFLEGFDKFRLNRLRTNIGLTYNINKHHSVNLSALLDYERELQIDSDKNGTAIKSLVHDRRYTLYAKLEYTFSF